MINKSDSRCAVVRFCYHSYDYRLNWTPLSPITITYYMASSVSGQDEPNRALWLATRAGKMEPSCPLGTTRCIPQAKFHQKPYNKSFIDQVCSVKMAGYWPRSFFASLWTSTSSRSINTQKKNLANIQPSWPHTWSITHTYRSLLRPFSMPTISKVLRACIEKKCGGVLNSGYIYRGS